MGSIPRSITVILQDDLVDRCKAGDDIVITSVPIRRWKTLKVDSRCNIDMALFCNNISVSNEQKGIVQITEDLHSEYEAFWKKYKDAPLKGRDLVLRSMCPQLYGLYKVKQAVALTLIGGVAMIKNGTRVRGESHLLMVGDPGTGIQ